MKLPSGMKVLYPADRIAARVAELGEKITSDHEGMDVLLIVIANGGMVFASDLMRAIRCRLYLDVIKTSSYCGEKRGDLTVQNLLSFELKGKHVILLDDILDSGKTLQAVKDMLLQQEPASLKTCVFLDKTENHGPEIQADYTGFQCPLKFVFGYGLDDVNRLYRNLPYIACL